MQERVLAILHNIHEVRQFGGPRTYNMIVTASRSIFAHMTDDMLKRAVAEAKEQEEADKGPAGLFHQPVDEASVAFTFGDRYRTVATSGILAEDPANFVIENSNINALVFEKKHTGQGAARKMVCEFALESRSATSRYLIDWFPEQDIKALKAVFGQRVKA